MKGEQAYLDLMQDILSNGIDSGDRTGTGTLSLFGRQIRFDLKEGFPLLTTKKVFFKAILIELLWLMRGETNVKFLQKHGVTIWDEWSDKNGDLGPVYGKSWRSFGSKPDRIPQPKPKIPSGYKETYLGVANGKGKERHLLKKTWEGMIDRCYNPKNNMYKYYGEKGVYVSNDWLVFENFEKDAFTLQGWDKKLKNPKCFNLDKDSIGDGFTYSKESCQWVSTNDNQKFKNNKIYQVEKNGILYKFTSPSDFCKEHGISNKNFSDLWSSNAKRRYGFKLISIEEKNPGVDQIKEVIERIKNNPSDRRLIVNAWDAYWVKYMSLPPCHTLFQFYVRNNKLSCQLYQRSADIFLGVPFNIASYALLTHLIANECGLEVGEFIHTFGDVHLYKNHIDQAKEQLSRVPLELPQVNINIEPGSLMHFIDNIVNNLTYEEIKNKISVVGYKSHPAIKASVSV